MKNWLIVEFWLQLFLGILNQKPRKRFVLDHPMKMSWCFPFAEKKNIGFLNGLSGMEISSTPQLIGLGTQKGHNLLSYFLFSKKFRKYLIPLPAFYLIMWLMKLPKIFEKIDVLKIGELVSF